jgi:hypothetical protein
MTYDDEILMAYVDGELDERRRGEIESALARDPELARRVEEQRVLRARLAAAFAPVLRQPAPAHLEALARGGGSRAEPRGNIVQFPAKVSRPAPTPWRAREWTAIAASLVLGVFLSWRFLAPAPGDFASVDGALVAAGDLAAALETKLASESAGSVRIGLSFKANDGTYCRSFLSRESATAGFACRDENHWNVSIIQSVGALPGGELRPAAADMPPAILEAIEARLSGEPLDIDAERAAREARWVTR